MKRRAQSSGITLTEADASVVKGMLERGDRQHDIASWFGVNGGRIAEIATGHTFHHIPRASEENLPLPGPYPAGREAVAAIKALVEAKQAIAAAEQTIHGSLLGR